MGFLCLCVASLALSGDFDDFDNPEVELQLDTQGKKKKLKNCRIRIGSGVNFNTGCLTKLSKCPDFMNYADAHSIDDLCQFFKQNSDICSNNFGPGQLACVLSQISDLPECAYSVRELFAFTSCPKSVKVREYLGIDEQYADSLEEADLSQSEDIAQSEEDLIAVDNEIGEIRGDSEDAFIDFDYGKCAA
eukprot:JP436875.1.p1 GENE.JP436875.1~~JP436875.1.p1  ORF type:complete len:190 (-),score=20.21 JP436875.1:119-688(-)